VNDGNETINVLACYATCKIIGVTTGANRRNKMPDISMCSKKDCPSFDKCYRAQATENKYRQAYGMFDNGGESCCDYYIPVAPKWTIPVSET